MKTTLVRIAATASVCAALLGISSIMAGRGGHPLPPPPVLCGCLCPDGSYVITHAPDENSCPDVCATACPSDM
jgi:hypothetical protein